MDVPDVGLPPPDTMGQAFEQLAATQALDAPLATRLRLAVGFRKLAVRGCSAIDPAIARAIASRRLRAFGGFAAWVETPGAVTRGGIGRQQVVARPNTPASCRTVAQRADARGSRR